MAKKLKRNLSGKEKVRKGQALHEPIHRKAHDRALFQRITKRHKRHRAKVVLHHITAQTSPEPMTDTGKVFDFVPDKVQVAKRTCGNHKKNTATVFARTG